MRIHDSNYGYLTMEFKNAQQLGGKQGRRGLFGFRPFIGVKIIIRKEGFACPGLRTLVLATPIKFEGRLLQVAGRIVRPAAGKKAVIVDYVDTAVPLLRRSAAARRVLFAGW